MRLITTMLGVALMTGTIQGCESRREGAIEGMEEPPPPPPERPREELERTGEMMQKEREQAEQRQGISEQESTERAFEEQEQGLEHESKRK